MHLPPDVIEPSEDDCTHAELALSRALGSRVKLRNEVGDEYLSDDSNVIGKRPIAVVLAESKEDLKTALRIAHATNVPIVPRAGGSGRTGGAVPAARGIVLATMGMNQTFDFDRREGTVLVGPGTKLSELHRVVEAEGWFYPPDPNSAELCCIAGNVAENAAGPRAFKYGATRDYVLGLDAFLMGGEELKLGRNTRKGVTGYDVTSLLVGSEGTLAVFGDIRLKLLPRPEAVMTLSLSFLDLGTAARAVERLAAAPVLPRCIEFLDSKTLAILRSEGNPIATRAGALLLVEVDGNEADCEHQLELLGNLATESGAFDASVAILPEQRKKLWDSRKQMSRAVRRRAQHKISEDVVVPRRHLPELVAFVSRIGEEHEIDTLCYGHAGDGNLHVNLLWNSEDEEVRVNRAIQALFRRTLELGGTLSGEHGIGLLKVEFLPWEQSAPVLALERRIKEAFDPRGLLNPGKIFPAGAGQRRPHGNC